jgi:hypothetical protein
MPAPSYLAPNVSRCQFRDATSNALPNPYATTQKNTQRIENEKDVFYRTYQSKRDDRTLTLPFALAPNLPKQEVSIVLKSYPCVGPFGSARGASRSLTLSLPDYTTTQRTCENLLHEIL